MNALHSSGPGINRARRVTILGSTGSVGQNTVDLLLRNPDDLDSQDKRSVVDQKTLFTGDRAGELQQKRYRTIQIIRGNRGETKVAARGP